MKNSIRTSKIWNEQVTNKQEDEVLREFVNSNLRNAWKTISGLFNDRLHLDRTPKQCRDRWLNFLEPSLTNLELTENDINKLFKLQKELGNK